VPYRGWVGSHIIYVVLVDGGYINARGRGREGTHAKGSCEPGQAGRCSHKQRTLVQWNLLFRQLVAGAIFLRNARGLERTEAPDGKQARGSVKSARNHG